MEDFLYFALSHINISLSNRYMSVKGTSGIACLGCLGVLVYELCAPKTNTKVCIGSAVGIVGFGAGYCYLDKKGNDKTNPKSSQEETSQQDPTPNASTSNIKKPTQQKLSDIESIPLSNYDDGQLIGKLIYIEDLCIIYSSPGVGKTVLALQIAVDIALGRISKIMLDDKGIHTPQEVFYYDGELDDKDYDKIFGGIDRESIGRITFLRHFYFKNTYQWVADVKERIASYHDCNITIVLDNISCICSSVNAESIRELFMNSLKNLQETARLSGVHLTFIVIAHTNKQFVLAGSSNLSNFASTVIGLDEEDDDHVKMTIDKDRKYGEMRHKAFRLLRKETADGNKYFENTGLIADIEMEPIDGDKGEFIRGHPISLVEKVYEQYKQIKSYRKIANVYGMTHAHWRDVIKDYEIYISQQNENDYTNELGVTE